MNLPFLKKPDTEKNFFLSLLVKPYKISAILFEEVNNKLFILSTSEAAVDSDIDQISSDELLQAADKTISSVEPSLPEGITVEKTIFSLPYDWIVESKIKEVDLSKLKNVCKSLGLKPIGYLTAIEAIVHYLDKSEGAPVSAVFLEITKSRVFIYLVKAGKIIETASGTVSESALITSEDLIKQIKNADVLPAKIILLDLENSLSIQQEFLSHKWSSGIPFLHVPQVVVLEKGFENEAVINGVAAQMELEVETDSKRLDLVDEANPTKSEDKIESKDEVITETDGDEFGFIKDDVAKVESVNASEDKSGAFKEDVMVGSDSLGSLSAIKTEDQPDVNYFKGGESDAEYGQAVDTSPPAKLPIFLKLEALMANLKNIKIPKTFPKLPSVGGIAGGSKNKLLIGIVGIIVFIIVASIIYYNFILQAHVIVFEDRRAVDKSSNITFTKDGGSDSIKMTIVQEEVKGDEDKNATGKKETGDKAKGSITIYNKSEDSKTFSSGTTVVGPNNLEFVLTDDVKVASTSSFSTSLSSANVKIEASDFGKEYNIPSGSNFSIKGVSTSDAIAKNSDATSGGSSKTTTVVSAKDLSDLMTLVTQKLQSDAVAKAQSEESTGEDILQDALASDVKDKSYTKKAGDEAASVSLSATIDYSIGKYNKQDLDNMVKNLSKNDVPGTYVLQEGDSKVEIVDIKVDKSGESASATLKVNAVYSPQIDPVKLAGSLKGATQNGADKKIRDISGVSDVNISFVHKLPLLPAILPFNSKNISIEIKH